MVNMVMKLLLPLKQEVSSSSSGSTDVSRRALFHGTNKLATFIFLLPVLGTCC